MSEVVKPALPTDSGERKEMPMARGVLDYFPAALAEVARLSKAGNDKHNPGEDLHWARGKSMDHADCIMRHLAERGTIDTDGITHSAKVAWRALALLQEELEAAGAPMARGARVVAENDAPLRRRPSQMFGTIVGAASVPYDAPKERAWNEGWKCPRCGTTELWIDETPYTVKSGRDVLCAAPTCLGYMVRE